MIFQSITKRSHLWQCFNTNLNYLKDLKTAITTCEYLLNMKYSYSIELNVLLILVSFSSNIFIVYKYYIYIFLFFLKNDSFLPRLKNIDIYQTSNICQALC